MPTVPCQNSAQEPEVAYLYPIRSHTLVSPSSNSRRTVVGNWQKYVHKVLVNGLGGLSLRRKSVVRLTDHPDMTSAVYHGRSTTQQQHFPALLNFLVFASSGII